MLKFVYIKCCYVILFCFAYLAYCSVLFVIIYYLKNYHHDDDEQLICVSVHVNKTLCCIVFHSNNIHGNIHSYLSPRSSPMNGILGCLLCGPAPSCRIRHGPNFDCFNHRFVRVLSPQQLTYLFSFIFLFQHNN